MYNYAEKMHSQLLKKECQKSYNNTLKQSSKISWFCYQDDYFFLMRINNKQHDSLCTIQLQWDTHISLVTTPPVDVGKKQRSEISVLQNFTNKKWVQWEDWGRTVIWAVSLGMIFHSPFFYFLCHHFSTRHFPAPCYPLLLIYHIPYLIPSMTLYWSTHYVFPACPSTLFWWFYTLAFLNDGVIWFTVSWYILLLENILGTSVNCFSSFWQTTIGFAFTADHLFSVASFSSSACFIHIFFMFLF